MIHRVLRLLGAESGRSLPLIISELIRILLETAPGERVMQPIYDRGAHAPVFYPLAQPLRG
jgi:phage baseplate assembly protein W